jgi:hypothetical protein
MSISFVHLRRILFGTSCAIVLGFGGTQALASPVQAAAVYACTPWEQAQCDSFCSGFGTGVKGRCTNIGFYDCRCEDVAPVPDPYG